jgi:type III restriction enzyme
MSNFEVPNPILNSPYEEPKAFWDIKPGEPPKEPTPGRRPAFYFYRPPKARDREQYGGEAGIAIELKLVNLIRKKLTQWRPLALRGDGGVSGTTHELLNYWRREGRKERLFFAQLEAAETVIFLTEARADFLQGIDIPPDEPSADRKQQGFDGFRRLACKMATGTGKTTVMGMLAAWSILNKVHDRGNRAYSDVVLVVCPNVTIRTRLAELDPLLGEASLYRKRDLVPEHLMKSDMTQGRVFVTNWHVFEPQTVQAGGQSAKVLKAGVKETTREPIRIGDKTTTSRGKRYLTPEDYERQVAAGMLTVLDEERDKSGNLVKAYVESARYVQSDRALLNHVLGQDVAGKQNIMVFNDEAHHAYRLRTAADDEAEVESDEEEALEDEELVEYEREATVWVEGLDKVHKLIGINSCLDFSATPYYLVGGSGQKNRVFPWTVCDFGLTDAIESGLVKIPQLAVRDTTGSEIPGYFNIWKWILPQLTPQERGATRAAPKPAAILKYAFTPIAMLAGLWDSQREKWRSDNQETRFPVFILVCKNTAIASVIYEWIANDNPPAGILPLGIRELSNTDGRVNTIRVDSKVVKETDTGQAKSAEDRWMRLTLDTVGRLDWPRDSQGRALYPEGFKELADALKRPLHPPGRDVRCVVSVGMLTEGWDCNTVTHIVGLRPFMSQLLCEQVVGRALRRTRYEVGADDRLSEQVAQIFGVPFEVVPFKSSGTTRVQPQERHHVYALPQRASLVIRFPRVEGYRSAVRGRIVADWTTAVPIPLDPLHIPPEVQMKATLPANGGRPALSGPGRLDTASVEPYRANMRQQQVEFDMAAEVVRSFGQAEGTPPAHVLFPQVLAIVQKYVREYVKPLPPWERGDIGFSPYFGWASEQIQQLIRPDASAGETPEVPIYESHRVPGSTAEVDFWTSRPVREVINSHVNCVVADTERWEQSAAYFIDTSPFVKDFVKNSGLGFAVPYYHNGETHDYVPDFIIRLKTDSEEYLILEVKGYDELAEVKSQAAWRWVKAVNADGRFGRWFFAMPREPAAVKVEIGKAFEAATAKA